MNKQEQAKAALKMFSPNSCVTVDKIIEHSGVIKEALEAMAVGGWQKIETAPMDGTSILVIGFSLNATIPVTAFWSNEFREWCLDDGENCYIYKILTRPATINNATHWMPLPKPPKGQDDE